MKRLLIFLFVFEVLSGCSSSQAPLVNAPLTRIPNLSVTDSLDFGTVPLGTSKDLSLRFQNTGTDTIEVTSQSLSRSSFSIPNLPLPQFSVAPGAVIWVTIRYTARDTTTLPAFDTVRSRQYYFVVALRNSWSYFSSMFPSAPIAISVSLAGLNGQWDGTPKSGFDFGAYAPVVQRGDTLQLQDSYSYSGGGPPDQPCLFQSHSTNVYFRIDTALHSIEWIRATYSEDDEITSLNCGGHGYQRIYKVITAHHIPLTKNGQVWSAVLKGATLSSVMDAVAYDAYAQGVCHENTHLLSVTGYDSTAALSISIY